MGKNFQCQTFFPSQDIKQNVLLNSYLHNWWRLNFKFIYDHPKAMVEKEGRTEIQKLEYLENEKSFLDEIKSIFHSFGRGYYLAKK